MTNDIRFLIRPITKCLVTWKSEAVGRQEWLLLQYSGEKGAQRSFIDLPVLHAAVALG